MKQPVLIVALAIFLITHAANLQIPLYGTYARLAGFGSGISALAFSTYVAGLLPTLILLGGASDRIGRKKVILASLLFACVATFLMIAQPTIYTLLITRVLQGIGVGLITGTGTAYLSTLMPQHSAKVAAYVSLTTALGFSSGAIFTNAVLSIQDSLVPLSYWIVFVLILGGIGLSVGIPEQATKPTSLIRLPLFPTKAIWAGLAIALAWSLAGIVGIILPAQFTQYGLPNWSGPMLFIIVITGVLFQPVARRMDAGRSLQLGSLLLMIGYVLFTIGAAFGILSLVLVGVAIAGTACYGFTYLGGLAQVVQLDSSQSARVASGYFVCAYLGYGIPVILIGFFSERFGITNTLVGFGVFFLVSNALLITVYQRQKKEKRYI
ncbi:MFS transporter [Aerosakkonemataceae cyanobacterium BLCC-F50]|uniref:MFS transporter n=1 Tax=Floridaenema flaviceps BLCC-F50 TaxID=3153642 RepID=A0ABV4Y3M8_9CYAN